MRKLVGNLSYANVMATIAVFAAIGGGAYAAGLAKDSVGSKQIRDGQVRSADVKDDSLTGADIRESGLDLPSPSVIAWPHNHSPGQPSSYPSRVTYPLDDATWTQSRDSIDVIYGQLDFRVPPGCSGGTVYLSFTLDGGGGEVVNFDANALSPIDLSGVFDPIINAGASKTHTISVEGTQMHCSAGGAYTVRSIDMGVVEFR